MSYLKTFLLTVAAFVTVLLVSRLKDIARFAVAISDHLQTGLYAVYQIPLILPMAIPLSVLLSSFLFAQNMSRRNEFTAFRALGLSVKDLFTPLLFTSILLSFLNFSICNELSPFCRRESKNLLVSKTSVNPLLLLQRQRVVKIKNVYLKMDVREEGNVAHHFTLIAHNGTSDRLNLITAKKLKISGEELSGEDVAICSHLHGEEDRADPLIIENQHSMKTDTPFISSLMKKGRQKLDGSSLNYRMLRLRMGEGNHLSKAAFVEILRRCSISLVVLGFTLVGFIFGIEQGRTPSKKPLFILLLLTFLFFASYLLGRQIRYHIAVSALVLVAPHVLIFSSCFFRYRQIRKGFS